MSQLSPSSQTGSRPRRARFGASAALGLLTLLWLAAGCGSDIEERMAEVRALQDVGQFSASIRELREILAIAPDSSEAAYRLGVALVQTGESSRAVWALQKAAESPDYRVVAGLLLASAHLDNENFEEAVRAADKVLEVDPERQVALQLRAKGQVGAGRFEEALVDAQRLITLYPDEYSSQVTYATALAEAGRLEEARIAFDRVKEMGLESGDPVIEPRACLAPALFASDELNDPAKAELLFEECVTRHPTDSVVIGRALVFFDAHGQRERATGLIRAALDAEPENLQLRSILATRLSADGQHETAEKVLLEAAERFGSGAAWNLMAGFYRRQQQNEKALEAIGKVIELSGGGNEQLRFAQADVLVDLGELERAEEVAGSLSEPTYATLIRGRILMERGDPRAALEAFERGIRNWPNNAGARYLAGLAAHQLGDHERAISELRESVRADAAASPAALLLARIHLDRKEYGQAAGMAGAALRNPQGHQEPQGFVIAARALSGQGRFDLARNTVENLLRSTGDEATASVERAAIERAAEGAEAALRSIEESGLDPTEPGHGALLRALTSYQLELGRADQAVGLVDRALRGRPDDPELHEIRGTLLARSERLEEGTAAFERSLALRAENPAALAGLGTLAGKAGRIDRAIGLFDRAAALAPEQPAYRYAAAQLSLQSGSPSARQRLEAVVSAAPGHAGARNDLAWMLAEQGGDLDRALELAEEAYRLEPAPEVLDTLGWVQLKRGDAQRAVATLEAALQERPESPTLLYHLAMALAASGDEARARDTVKRALEQSRGEFPDAEAAVLLLADLEGP